MRPLTLVAPGATSTRDVCLSRSPVEGPTITKHHEHICYKTPGHRERHRCWACIHEWALSYRDNFGG